MIESLYKTYAKELTLWCISMTGDKNLSDDLVHEAFLRAILHESILYTLSPSQQRSWLYKTIKNLYIDKYRHGVFEIAIEESPEPIDMSNHFTDIDCEQLLSFLPDDERLLFIMRYFQGYNATELGTLFQLPPGTVRSKLSSARKHLKNIWK